MKLEEVADRLAIQDRIYQYAFTYDQGDFPAFADVFWPDAVFEFDPAVGDMPRRLDGRDAIVRHMQQRYDQTLPARRRHMITNSLLQLDGDQARVDSYILLGSTSPDGFALPVVGRYEDELRRDEGTWRFSRRVLLLDADLS